MSVFQNGKALIYIVLLCVVLIYHLEPELKVSQFRANDVSELTNVSNTMFVGSKSCY